MSGTYDLNEMDLGQDGWKIKVRAAEALVRQRNPELPEGAHVRIAEIHSSRANDAVSVEWHAETGAFLWKKRAGKGIVVTTLSEFNSYLNRFC